MFLENPVWRSPSCGPPLPPGIALKHVHEKVFTSDSGMRRNVPKVLVVVTDGRSQDDVKKSAEKLQHSGNVLSIAMCVVVRVSRSCFSVFRFSPKLYFSVSVLWLIHKTLKNIPAVIKLPVVIGSLRVVFVLCVCFTPHRLQCVRGWSCRCWHVGVESYRQQAQWETCVCGGRLRRFCQDPGQPDHLHLWNSHFQ